jgi:hypothetical protein
MSLTFKSIRWVLFIAYAIVGGLALLLAIPAGLRALGLPIEMFSFTPARIAALPWSLPTWLMEMDPVTVLALAGVGYILNLCIGYVLAQGGAD